MVNIARAGKAKKRMNSQHRKILIVEDEAALSQVLGDRLIREGFEVFKAKDGIEGLKQAQKQAPDIILLDIVMPSMDGVTMLKKLRERPATEGIPVIIISNLSEIERITEVLHAKKGVIEHIVKSHWSLDGLVKKINDTLKVYQMLKE